MKTRIINRDRFTFPWMTLFYIIGIAFLTFFLVIPVFKLLTESVSTLFNSTRPLPRDFFPYMIKITWNTLKLAILTTLTTIIIATPLAFLIVKFKVKFANLWVGLLTIPLITPAFISSFATIILLGRSGVITMALRKIGIQLPSIYGLGGLVITQTLHTIPYALLIIISGLRTVPKHIEEAAQSMGTGTFKTQYSIVLPNIYPHILLGGLMVFLTSMGDIGGPLIIGGSYKVLSIEIYSNFISYLGDDRIPLIFSAWVLMIAFALLFFVNKLMKLTNVKNKFRVGIMEYDIPSVKRWGTFIVALITIVFLLPYVAIVINSFGTFWAYNWLPAKFTLNNYRQVLSDWLPIRNTMILIFSVTPIIVLLGIVFGNMFNSEKRLRWFNYFTLLPFVLPGVVIGISLIQTYSKASIFGMDLSSSVLLLIIALSVRRLPFVLKTIEAGFAKVDDKQEEAAFSLGASKFKAFTSVVFPQIRPAVFSAIVIGIVKVVTELSSALIIYPPGWQNMSLYIAYYVDEGFTARASAMAVLLMVIVGIGTAISNNLARKDALRYE
ncbi:hypothetical protein AT15_05340 [Kosmotoga arenicorallina S304]|uniref:ABC transmembrane type-1 domain-containing protein n=1 Tax=Kosmotoga arenicorallina S304 TaxID=1453497 RepID=A0A176JUJ6_9BACT|nr:iron ABC transporter permease [Kosmotoga arenicorallina]OAA27116.1 hypothetical protein AT15_05340 [Kosmotoga arenicorallina S304]